MLSKQDAVKGFPPAVEGCYFVSFNDSPYRFTQIHNGKNGLMIRILNDRNEYEFYAFSLMVSGFDMGLSFQVREPNISIKHIQIPLDTNLADLNEGPPTKQGRYLIYCLEHLNYSNNILWPVYVEIFDYFGDQAFYCSEIRDNLGMPMVFGGQASKTWVHKEILLT